jgi:hypothetical protein
MLFFFAVCIAASFASDDTISELDDWGDKLINLTHASWVQIIIIVTLVIEFGLIAWSAANGEGGSMFKKIWPAIVASIGIQSAKSIIQFFWTSNS